MKIDLLFACDENYAPYAGVVLRSVWKNRNLGESFRVWFISDGISEQTRVWLKNTFVQMEISFLTLPSSFMADAPIHNKHLSRAAYARLAMGSVLPKSVTRVIYMDCDVLVRHSLADLWSLDLQDKTLAGVEDWGIFLWRKQGLFVFPAGEHYVSSGLLLVNVDRWRELDCEKRCLAWLSKHADEIRFEDQDVLNGALMGEIALLPARWDVVLHLSKHELAAKGAPAEWAEALDNPYIIHFASFNKPWREECSLSYAAAFQAYMKELGLPLKRMAWRVKWGKVLMYWKTHPVFFIKPKFWKTWRTKRWGVFF
uniref:Universal stress protein A n=1 Tax=uncultured Elusimicrobia bacterium TaxID=699876 RepID=A0A650EN66_9BACT|nr:universal stress protein A [uncultured Elusimicrobia bacterium]